MVAPGGSVSRDPIPRFLAGGVWWLELYSVSMELDAGDPQPTVFISEVDYEFGKVRLPMKIAHTSVMADDGGVFARFPV